MTADQPIREFNEYHIKDIGDLNKLNNDYAAIWGQLQQTKQKLTGLKDIIHKIKHDEISINNIMVPWLGNQLRRLTEKDKDDYLKAYVDAFSQTEIQVNSIEGQLKHRGDELGELRMRMLRVFWGMLVHQHGFTDQELFTAVTDVDKREQLIRPLAELPKVDEVKI